MTSATTLKLPTVLKERIAPLAEAAGVTAHAWMVQALERQAALSEAREAFIREAEEAAAALDSGGPRYAAEDVATYLLARADGAAPPRPRPARPSAAKKRATRARRG